MGEVWSYRKWGGGGVWVASIWMVFFLIIYLCCQRQANLLFFFSHETRGVAHIFIEVFFMHAFDAWNSSKFGHWWWHILHENVRDFSVGDLWFFLRFFLQNYLCSWLVWDTAILGPRFDTVWLVWSSLVNLIGGKKSHTFGRDKRQTNESQHNSVQVHFVWQQQQQQQEKFTSSANDQQSQSRCCS